MAASSAPLAPPLPPGVWLEAMREQHASAIFAVQVAIYPPHLLEAAEHILARARVFPEGSVVALARARGGGAAGLLGACSPPALDGAAVDGEDVVVVGYAQAYPWPAAAIAAAVAGPPAAALLFLHEVSVDAQGAGVGRALLAHCLRAGRGARLPSAMLVAVMGRAPLWAHVGGFAPVRDLGDYGDDSAGAAALADAAAAAGARARARALPPMPSQASTDRSAVVMVAAL